MDHELGTSGTPEHAYEEHVKQRGTSDYDTSLGSQWPNGYVSKQNA